jgi:C-terminal processing protease CtpA/Prc
LCQPKGAAVTDGRLRAGDRLVSVNQVGVGALAQQQVVGLLRATPPDSAVDILVERAAPTAPTAHQVRTNIYFGDFYLYTHVTPIIT